MRKHIVCREKQIASKIVKQLFKSKYSSGMVSEMGKISYKKRKIIDTPEKAASCFSIISNKQQEHFAILTLDAARQFINSHIVTIGTLTSSIVHPREVFALALEDRAASIIIAHNHPSGNLDISVQDRKVTDIMKKAGELMNIPMDDHLIVTENEFRSVPGE